MKGYHAASGGPEPLLHGYLSHLEMTPPLGEAEFWTAKFHPQLLPCVRWLGDGMKKIPILFRLERGRAVALRHTDENQSQFDELLRVGNVSARQSANLTMFLGQVKAPRLLALPAPVAAHVTGGPLPGFAWAWGFNDTLELWTEETRARETMTGIEILE